MKYFTTVFFTNFAGAIKDEESKGRKRGRVFIIDRFRHNVKNEDLTPMVAQGQIDIGKKELTMVVDYGTVLKKSMIRRIYGKRSGYHFKIQSDVSGAFG